MRILPAIKWLFTVLLLSIFTIANAQKLPSEQKTSVRAPADIKIDGKAKEWSDKLQAYSHHTQFYYTISNDDNNLYLTIQANDGMIVNRILKGGITLTINKSGKKKDLDGIQITYPLIKGFVVPVSSFKGIATENSPGSNSDSLKQAYNARMGEKSKEIKIIGMKDLDTLTSVYNTDDIKAAAAFNNKMVYTYELSVPLKHLGMNIIDGYKFIYQLKINELEYKGIMMASGISFSISGPGAGMGQDATDFWGEYTLAK